MKNIIKKINIDKTVELELPSLSTILQYLILLPIIGNYYIFLFFSHLGINYRDYFNLNDSISILYYKGLVYVLFFTMLFPMALLGLLFFTKNKNRQDTEDISSNNKEYKKMKIGLFPLVINSIIFAYTIYLILHSIDIEANFIAVFIFFILVALISYFYKYRLTGSIILLGALFFYTYYIAKKDAIYVNKEKLTYTIIASLNNKDSLILSEKYKNRWLLYKTTDYYFIKDSTKKRVEIIPFKCTDVKYISFAPSNLKK